MNKKGSGKVKCAVVGPGGMGSNGLIAFTDCEWTELVAIAENDDERRQEVCSQYKVKGYKDYLDLINDKDVELIYNATPNFLHKDVIVNALQAGKHVFSEKPLATTPQQCRQILNTARKSKAKLQIDFEMRFSVLPARIKKIIDSGEIGQVRNIYFNHSGGGGEFKKEARRKAAWTNDMKKVGGYYIEEGCHRLDIFRWMMGSDAKEVLCIPAPEIRGESTWHRAYAEPATSMYFFKNGGFANLITLQHRGAACPPAGMEPDLGHEYGISLIGTGGSIISDFWRGTIKIFRFKGKYGKVEFERQESYTGVLEFKWHHDARSFLKDFALRVKEGRPVLFDVKDVSKTMAMAFASEQSMQKGGQRVGVKHI